MERCLQLARLGAGTVAPNPMVGAVLLHDGIIIGEGYHMQYGQAHAEVNCINSVLEQNRQFISASSLYVSLEPCVHFGKTPPCADLIITNKIQKVVVGCSDQYHEVNGKGIAKLKAAGVQVTESVLEQSARLLNKRFFTFHHQKRPYIILKWAQSSDGKIAHADFSSIPVSNDFSNRWVHKWRSEEAAIMVGTNTALYDNPSLTNRLWTGNHPIRVVIDKKLQLPLTHQLFSSVAKTIVFNNVKDEFTDSAQYCKLEENSNLLPQIMNVLFQQNIQSVLVEGGTKLLQSIIDANLWDEARVITNEQMIIGQGIEAPILTNHRIYHTENLVNDRIQFYQPIFNSSTPNTSN